MKKFFFGKAAMCDFPAIYEIMKESFPPEERRSFDAAERLFENPKYSVYVLRDRSEGCLAEREEKCEELSSLAGHEKGRGEYGCTKHGNMAAESVTDGKDSQKSGQDEGKITTFMALYELGDMVFFEHLATAGDARNRGLGKLMMDTLREKFNGTPIFFEVEPPECDMAVRRIEFYKRLGFKLLDFPYIQPPIEEGKAAIPLMIMTTCERVSREEFERAKALIYREVYGTDDKF